MQPAILTIAEIEAIGVRSNAVYDRVNASMTRLIASLDAQAVAIALFQANMAELRVSVAGLRNSLTRYDTSLVRLQGQVTGLGDTQRTLAATMDRYLTGETARSLRPARIKVAA